jgi:hypothetical protein
MAVTRTDDDDDVLDELPPLGGELDDEEPVGVEDAPEPELGTLGTSEEVGLDDRAGGVELSVEEMLDTADEEGERWTDGSEAAGDEIGSDGLERVATTEYGWIEDTEASDVGDLGEEIGFGDAEETAVDDAGEEGVDEIVALPSAGADEDAVALPPLRELATEAVGADALSEDLDIAGDALIEGAELSFEEEERLSGASLPPALAGGRVEVEWLGPSDDALYDVALVEGGVLAAGERLYLVRGGAFEPIRVPLELDVLTSLAVGDGEARAIAVGTRLSGALASEDGGGTFAEVNGWRSGRVEVSPSVAFFVAAEKHVEGTRLWGRTRSGALFRSDDFGASWSRPLLPAPVAAIACDPRGGVVALLVPARGDAQIASSDDGGHRWTVREVAGLVRSADSEAEYHVAAHGRTLAVASDGHVEGPHVSHDEGVSWSRLDALPSPGAIALVEERGAVVLYASLFFASADRGVLIRHVEGVSSALVLDVRAERERREIEGRGDPEGDNRVFALAARRVGTATELFVASGAGLFRVRVEA